ncbi:hypothetical protein BLNAU_5453 [Blattamonas nauphoetae]|uniref:Uncharacterized protein n=1 Tax=Blattamonas nauphoetae TaxID=2049346 RepID=A0ABQ9Y7H7_9EUKA|nr:hypothetical protein BLNAU_5453 [Blattamonas nauphoetae]
MEEPKIESRENRWNVRMKKMQAEGLSAKRGWRTPSPTISTTNLHPRSGCLVKTVGACRPALCQSPRGLQTETFHIHLSCSDVEWRRSDELGEEIETNTRLSFPTAHHRSSSNRTFQLFIEVSVTGCHHRNTSLTTPSEIHAQLNGIANSVDDLRMPFTTSIGPQQDETLKLAKFIQCPLCSLFPSKAASFLILISPLIPRAAPKPSIDLKLDQLLVLGSTVIDADPSNISLLITDTQIKACQLSRTDISEINSSATQHSMGTLSFTFFGTLTTLFAVSPRRLTITLRMLHILTVLFTTRSPFLVSFSSPTQTFTCIRWDEENTTEMWMNTLSRCFIPSASEFHLRMCECRVQLDDNTNTPPRQSTANTDLTKDGSLLLQDVSLPISQQSHPTLPLGLAAVASGAAHSPKSFLSTSAIVPRRSLSSISFLLVAPCRLSAPHQHLVFHLYPSQTIPPHLFTLLQVADTNIVREGHTTPSPSLRQTG